MRYLFAIVLFFSLGTESVAQTFYKTDMTLAKDGLYPRERFRNTHERTHAINAKLRNKWGGACLFLMDGKFVWFQEPRFTVADVNRKVKFRGGVSWYLTGQPARVHNSTPLYIFDEWIAYTNGSIMAGRDGGIDYSSTLQFAMEFAHYTATLIRMLPDAYKDKKEITLFWIWNAKRLDVMAQKAKDTGWLYKRSNDNWRAEMQRTIKEFES